MAVTLTATADYQAVVSPEPADDATADTAKAGDIQEALQTLVNRDEWLLTYGGWVPPVFFACLDTTTLLVSGLAATVSTYLISSQITSTPAGLASNTCYYLYCAPGPTLEVSTTAPQLDLRYKTGDATRRYVGTFATDGGGAIYTFASSRGRYTLTGPRSATSGTLSNASWTSLQLLGMPPHARIASVRIRGNANSDVGIRVRPDGASSAAARGIKAWGVGSNPQDLAETHDLVLSSAQKVELQLDANVANVTAEVETLGFQE